MHCEASFGREELRLLRDPHSALAPDNLGLLTGNVVEDMKDNKEGEEVAIVEEVVSVVDQLTTNEEVNVAETSAQMEKLGKLLSLPGHVDGTEAKVGFKSSLCAPESNILNSLFPSLHFLSTAPSFGIYTIFSLTYQGHCWNPGIVLPKDTT